MENELICLDTSVLIDYFRKTKKENSFFYDISKQYQLFAVSVITSFEIYSGSTTEQKKFWDKCFQRFQVLSFDQKVNDEAVRVFKNLKATGNLIDIPDLFIAATAISNKLKLVTLNAKHFNRIEGLELITPNHF
jgi:predicted nucleic acid-binding protein